MRGISHAAGWTEDRIDRLKKLWSEGKSASEIAKALACGVTRNGVIGKVHRLGLAGDRGLPAKPTMIRPPRAPKVQQPTRPLDMRRPPKSGGGNRPAIVHGKLPNAPTTPQQTDAVRTEKQVQGRKVLAGFTAANDDAILLVGRPYGSCGWPVGEPERMADQLCCGASTKIGSPYCARHTAMATAPMTKWGRDMERSVRRYL